MASERLGDVDNAIEQMKNANVLSTDNLDYRFELGRLFFNRGVTRQPNLSQSATKRIAETELTPEGEEDASTTEELSVQPSQPAGAQTTRNEDINIAEQIFLSILAANNNHANSLYSLAVLYEKVGEKDNARAAANSLLNVISDQPMADAVREQFRSVLE